MCSRLLCFHQKERLNDNNASLTLHGVKIKKGPTMTSFRVPLPEKFDFSRQEEWPKWSRRFERFRQASRLVKKEEESQLNMLIYSVGDQADDILNSFNLRA